MLENTPTPEASVENTGIGATPDGDGWFILNVADAPAIGTDRFGKGCLMGEPRPGAIFQEFGINIRVLDPGQPSTLYHREDASEAFLVLSGECIAIVEGQERPMRKGDFLYTPAATAHAFVGAGDGPCAVLMVGARRPGIDTLYPADDTAAKHGASVPATTADSNEAYGDAWSTMQMTKIGVPW